MASIRGSVYLSIMPQPVGDRDSCTLTTPSVALLCAGLTWTAGCSFVAVSGPPPDHARRDYFDCTTSNLAPAIDLALTALTGLAALNETLSDDTSQRERPLAIGIPIALAAVAAVSAFNGFHDTSACADAKAALAHRLEQRREPATEAGCHADIECKGQRICVAGQCTDPPPLALPNAPASQPAEPPQPAAPPTADTGAPTKASPQAERPAVPAPAAAPPASRLAP